MTAYRLDATRSRLLVRTRAEGLLARLAHDLELELKDVDGAVDGEGDRASGELHVPASGVRVLGVLKGGTVDAKLLSGTDKAEIADRVRDEVFRGESLLVKIARRGDEADLEIAAGTRRSARLVLPIKCDATAERVVVRFRAMLSLRTLGVGSLKGPMGAFRVADDVEIDVDALFEPLAPKPA